MLGYCVNVYVLNDANSSGVMTFVVKCKHPHVINESEVLNPLNNGKLISGMVLGVDYHLAGSEVRIVSNARVCLELGYGRFK